MIKNTLLALVAIGTLAGAAAPVFADSSDPGYAFGAGSSDLRSLHADQLLQRLHEKGIQASAVEEWGDLVRAYVIGDDGKTRMEYFRPDTLQRVS